MPGRRARNAGRTRHRSQSPSGGRLRLELAQAAARIMAEEQVFSFQSACEKALRRMGVRPAKQDLPSNLEIDRELASYQRLFGGAHQQRQLAGQRQVAVEAMRLLSEFRPRLTGAVLRGTATRDSAVVLHLFADRPEQVTLFLLERRLAFEQRSRELRWPDGSRSSAPVLAFRAGEQAVELVVLPPTALAHPPLSPVTGRKVERAGLEAVLKLVAEPGESQATAL